MGPGARRRRSARGAHRRTGRIRADRGARGAERARPVPGAEPRGRGIQQHPGPRIRSRRCPPDRLRGRRLTPTPLSTRSACTFPVRGGYPSATRVPPAWPISTAALWPGACLRRRTTGATDSPWQRPACPGRSCACTGSPCSTPARRATTAGCSSWRHWNPPPGPRKPTAPLPHLAGWARRTADVLRRRWPDADLDFTDWARFPPYSPRR